MTALIGLICSIGSALIGAIGWIFYWIILPILLYIAVKIFMLILSFSEWRESRTWAPTRGYKGKRKWFD